jgi:excisionase family DNA binding protein
MSKQKNILTRNEVADFLRVDKSTVSRLAKSREISCFRIGSRLLFRHDDVISFIENRIVDRMEKSREVC